MLNPKWLNTFVTLVDTGHFTKTAEKLFMTQPGVSQHIHKLEHASGHLLIRREKKSFELTEQGLLVYQYAMQLVKDELALFEKLSFDDPFSGHCAIACSGALALILYPQLLDLQARHSKIVVEFKAAPNHQILSDIQQGLIDIGIVTNIPNPHLFDVQEFGKEQLCLVVPANTEADHDEMNVLMDLGLIAHPDAEHYLSLYFAQNQSSVFTGLNISDIPVSGYINQIGQILQPVAKGLGFTVLPKSAVDSFHDVKQLKVLASPRPVLEPLYLVKKRGRVLPARIEMLNSVLLNIF